MDKIYFGGCSITEGDGFAAGKEDPRIYPNLLVSNAINDSEGGSSNIKIFLKAATAIVDNLANVYIIQWSALHRHWIYPTPDSGIHLSDTKDKHAKWYQERNHDYGNIIQLIQFCRILQDLAFSHNAKLLFINGLVNWSNDIEWMKELVADASSDHERFIENLQNNMELIDWNLWINPWSNMYDTKLDVAEDNLHPGPLTHKHIADQIRDKLIA